MCVVWLARVSNVSTLPICCFIILYTEIVPSSRKLGTRIFRNRTVPSRPVPEIRYAPVYNITVMWSWWESIQWASGSEWWRQQNKTRHLRQWLLLTPFWTQLSLHTGWRDGKFSLVPRPSAPHPVGKFSDGASCGGSGDETGDNWWHKVDVVVPVCQLKLGLLPFHGLL